MGTDDIEREVELALALLMGRPMHDGKGLLKTEYLSRYTSPTENEARNALGALLVRISKGPLADERLQEVLAALALAFCAEPLGPLKVMLKRRSKGHSDRSRDYAIAYHVQWLRNRRVKGATARVAEVLGLDERHIKRIYARHKDELNRVASDGRSGAMASDRLTETIT